MARVGKGGTRTQWEAIEKYSKRRMSFISGASSKYLAVMRRTSSGLRARLPWLITNVCCDYAVGFPKTNAAAYLRRLLQSIMERWRKKTVLSCPLQKLSLFFFSFWCPQTLAYKSPRSLTGWLGRTCCILEAWQAHGHSSCNLQKVRVLPGEELRLVSLSVASREAPL